MASNMRDSSENQDIMPKKPMKTIMYLIAGTIMLVVGFVFGVSFDNKKIADSMESESVKKEDKKAIAKKKKTILAVEVISPKVAEIPLTISADGTLVAKNTASISAKINGVVIQEILVKEGDWVEKGQTLAIFDPDTAQHNLVQAEAKVAQAESSFNNANANVRRVLPLLKIDAVSKQEVDRYVSQAEQAKAILISAQAQLNTQRIALDNTKVVAPVSGVISQKNAQIGAVPQQALFEIIEGGMLEWQAKINPAQLNQIKMGMPVFVKAPNKKVIQGNITRIDPVTGNDRQVRVSAILKASKDVPIRSGMLLSGDFVLGKQPQIIVPVSSVVGYDGYDYLMLIENIHDQDGENIGTIKRKKVKLGKQFNDAVSVQSKLPKNIAVVRQGGAFLSDGDVVRLSRQFSKPSPLKNNSNKQSINEE